MVLIKFLLYLIYSIFSVGIPIELPIGNFVPIGIPIGFFRKGTVALTPLL